MGSKLQTDDLKLYKRCDEVLHYIWDPIGVAGAPDARDEYDSYLPQVFKLLRDGVGEDQLTDYLVSIETNCMGMSSNHVGAKNAAIVLLAWCEWASDERP